MHGQRWWHVAVVATAIIVTTVLPYASGSSLRVWGGFAVVAAFVLGWFLIGRHAWRSRPAAIAFTIIIIAVAGMGTAFSPWLATIQIIVFPLVWTISATMRGAILANVGVAVSVGVGQTISTGDLLQAVIIETISLTFSLSIGFWIHSIERTSLERQRLLDELQAAQSELASLNQAAGVTSERERLAREIHDTIAQDLTGLVLLAQRASRELDAGDTAAASEQLALLEDGARTALAETRALVASTAPPSLDEGGIAAALDRLAQRYERETAIAVTARVDVETALDRDLEVVLLRCAQEGLANVRKHSGASRAAITLVARTSELSLRVSDNGSGFDPAEKVSGYGLSGMRDRLALVGGTLDLETGEDGTTLLVTLPAASPLEQHASSGTGE